MGVGIGVIGIVSPLVGSDVGGGVVGLSASATKPTAKAKTNNENLLIVTNGVKIDYFFLQS